MMPANIKVTLILVTAMIASYLLLVLKINKELNNLKKWVIDETEKLQKDVKDILEGMK